MKDVADFKYYNLCLPKEVISESKLLACRKGITLKEYLARAIVEANIKEKEGINDGNK